MHWLKDGVAKCSSDYFTNELAARIGISEEQLLSLIDSPSVLSELEAKSFTIAWKEGCIALTWLEEGINGLTTDIKRHYYEENGRFYLECRIINKLIYLDGTERIVKDTGDPKRVCITERQFAEAKEEIRRSNESKD